MIEPALLSTPLPFHNPLFGSTAAAEGI